MQIRDLSLHSKLEIGDTEIIKISRKQARRYFDGDTLGEEFESALDTAQGDCADGNPQFIVLMIEA